MTTHKPVIGVVGGIGSGKSFVAAELARRGGYLISGDALGHEGLRQPEIKAQVIARWGTAVLDALGEVDRRKLAAIVFDDAEELRALEAVQFPYIGRRIRHEIFSAEADASSRFIVLDAAVLLEASWPCDHILFVEAPRAVRLERLRTRRAWTEAELDAREAAQLSLERKRQAADAVIDNGGTAAALARQVDEILSDWGLQPPSRPLEWGS